MVHSSRMSSYYVRIGTVMAPNVFWVSKVPLGEYIVDTKFSTVLEMEHSLSAKYTKGKDERNTSMDDIPTIRTGIKVACRRHPSHQKWYRGEVVNVVTLSGKLCVQVFLMDYGEFLPTIPVDSCIRKLLSPEMITYDPQAFQLILAGLCPLSYKINRQIGMNSFEPVASSHWPEVALKLVNEHVDSSPLKLGKVTFCNEDALGRVHGHLSLIAMNSSLNFHDLLVDNRLALFLGDKLERDMSTSGAGIHDFKDENILNDSLASHEGPLEVPIEEEEDEKISTLIAHKLQVRKCVSPKVFCPLVPYSSELDATTVEHVMRIPAGMDLGILPAKKKKNKSHSQWS